MKQYLGVDGGGTSTSFLLFDEEGNELHHYIAKSLHFMSVGFEKMKDGFKEVREYFTDLGYDVDNFEIVMGLGGYGSDPIIRQKIDEIVLDVFPQSLLMSDSQLATVSSLGGKPGVFLISGTGSIAMYYDGENFHRQGGFGYHIGDEGSGFWIGKQILSLFTKEVDNRRERSSVYKTIMKYYSLSSPYELIAVLNNESEYRFTVASLAGVFANSEDEEVLGIFKQAGCELAAFANGFKVPKHTRIALGGSVLVKNKLVRESCISALNDGFDVFSSEHKVEYAAYLIKHNQG